ncbi:MAG: GreA/GreB family elongation factor, partial [Lentisphaeria bacterium]|nr:GreA/GreB family elongation factor [Lentisphaeria bacterium]
GTMSQEAFDPWWEEKAAETAPAPKKRSLGNARSLLELQLLMKDIPAEELSVTAEDAARLSRLFTNIRPGMTPKDLELLAACMAVLAGAADTEVLSSMFGGLRGKLPFFPAEITDNIPLKNLEIWGRIPVKLFPGFLKVAELLYSKQDITKLSMMLPLRCVNVMFKQLSNEELFNALSATKNLRSDVILVIWKNRANYPDEIRKFISMENICRALSEDGLPKEWTAAQRELKAELLGKDDKKGKADFQKFVLANAGSNIQSIISPIQRMRNMAPGECQSLLVKLARHSAELKAHIEGGEGKKLLAGQSNAGQAKQNETPMTSLKSFKELQDELDNIIKVQVPENNKAIEIARGFGDFRENAEYDAAKERRRFLQRRRSELERLVATVQPINFLEFKADTSKISMGTEVVLQDESGTEKTYSIVGAWDGNPDLNRVSYKTKIGETMLGAKVGDSLTLPDGTKVTVKSIAPLNADLAKELSPAE